MSAVQKRPDAWRWTCERCGQVGEWRDRKWWAAQEKSAHDVDRHGGALRAVES